ncbi:23S rRNA (adenine(2030)-N(6))-methyltransferase RlmJ [Oceanobacter mangrovi]|uniref:23S rRNA (adenine(2030)-N(6))-methyltransferase RlmJ n=1 Tax=Oceanobacter mangrovi TaxID=2862510 RepID=UPI001C8D2197|nr:23S rRNA (adenine(2030)-N(6))-methyltransferase RlmJ [Oceanobacter mangrovi]
MLSYLHSFHAGNFADVLKHLVEAEVLAYLCRKDKPFVYIDTHSAAGIYQLNSHESAKNREYLTGIGRLQGSQWPELENYLSAVQACQDGIDEPVYPGSPAIAQHFLREQDKAVLFELHPREFGYLEQLMRSDRRISLRHEDGFQGLVGLLPTQIRRGLVLMDPPYEVKTDYQTVVDSLAKAYRRMATATYALWYPVVERQRIDELERQLVKTGIRNIQLFELGIRADSAERGMTSAGMILINPPFTLKPMLEQLLPKLAKQLAGEHGNWRCEVLVEE